MALGREVRGFLTKECLLIPCSTEKHEDLIRLRFETETSRKEALDCVYVYARLFEKASLAVTFQHRT